MITFPDIRLQNGLLEEILELRAIAGRKKEPTDYTKGIFQAIGYKEFDAYLEHCESQSIITTTLPVSLRPDLADTKGVELFNQAVEEMKINTHQLAKKQVAWVRNKLQPDVTKRGGDDVFLLYLDGTGEFFEEEYDPE